VLKLLESPYDPILEGEESVVQIPLENKDELQTATERKESLNSAEVMSRYLSKPPDWSLSLCVT
jgi:hypothetical protein